MLLKDIIDTINYHISKKLLLKIERNNIDEIIIGFPIMLSEKFLLMTVINDFHDEGYTIVKVDDISDAYSNDNDLFYEKICILEGLKSIVQPEFLNEVYDYNQILNDIKIYDGLISIQCEKQIEKCTFFLGKIIEVYTESVIFKGVGVDGNWDEETDEIFFSEITQITFGNHYAKIFYKYTV